MSLRSISVVGLARSGKAAAELALTNGITVYATDSGDNETLRDVAEDLTARGADVELGNADVAKMAKTDVVVVSPGVPPLAPPLDDPRLARVRRISELEFASRFIGAKIIAITGTNGKSTTTALTGHLLALGGLDVEVAGNIGNALSNVALKPKQPDWVVVEASSFQLADIDRFTPNIGAVTNLAPDHLDRYASVEEYYNDKRRLFKNSSIDSIWVLNGDQPDVVAMPGEAAGRRLTFRLDAELGDGEHGAFVDRNGDLMLKVDSLRMKLVHSAELPLLGAHNQANALAAALISIGTGIPLGAIREGLRTFAGLPHRLQIVGERDGVQWINDSKATNVASTAVALQSMRRPTVLLLGGRHKGEPYTALLPHMGRVKRVIAYGEAAGMIAGDLQAHVAVQRVGGSFDEVVAAATAAAQTGDAVLLSPACSSFDMFQNYEERGEAFTSLAQRRKHG